MWRLAFVVGLIVLGVAPSGFTASPTASFAFTTFDAPFPGATNTEAGELNNLGTSVGDYCDATGNLCHGFKRSANGVFTSIDVPGTFSSTTAFGINTTGVIVGQYFLNGRHCFVLNANGFTSIDVPFVAPAPGGIGGGCRGINDAGQIVGIYVVRDPTTGARHRHGFLLSGGVFTPIDAPVPGTTLTSTHEINNAGQIVGRYVANGVSHGFLLDGTSFTTIDFPGAKETDAGGINDEGQVVGTYRDANDLLFGYIMTMNASQDSQGGSSSPTFKQIVLPGAAQNVAGVVDFDSLNFNAFVGGINDRGQITGTYLGFDGNFHGFITAPRQDFEVTASAVFPSATSTVITGVFEGDPVGEGSFTLSNISNSTAGIQWELFALCSRFQPNLVLTSSTGDQIFADLLLTICQTAFSPVPSTGVVSGFYRIVGGTGQFGGASGSGFVTGTFAIPAAPSPLTPATLTVTLVGTISR